MAGIGFELKKLFKDQSGLGYYRPFLHYGLFNLRHSIFVRLF